MNKNFLSTLDFSQSELGELVNDALKLKSGEIEQTLKNKVLGLYFFNPSLRSRVSLEAGMNKLGGSVIDVIPSPERAFTLEFGDDEIMDKGTIEHIKDAARVVSRYCNVIAIRASDLVTTSSETAKTGAWEDVKKDKVVSAFAKYATVPVINMESNVWHPCQALGDMMTIKERLGEPKKKKYVMTWAYHPKALPMATPNSQILSAIDLGMDVTIAYPEGWDLDPEIMESFKERAREAGGTLSISHNQKDALADADIVCVKSWGSLKNWGDWESEKSARANLKDWIVDEEKMKLTCDAGLMHCLPVRRGVEISHGALDGVNSLVIDEAENRMWAQMAVLNKLLADK